MSTVVGSKPWVKRTSSNVPNFLLYISITVYCSYIINIYGNDRSSAHHECKDLCQMLITKEMWTCVYRIGLLMWSLEIQNTLCSTEEIKGICLATMEGHQVVFAITKNPNFLCFYVFLSVQFWEQWLWKKLSVIGRHSLSEPFNPIV